MKDTNKVFYLLLFVLALAVNFAGINVKFFTDDQGLYASIAKNLVYKKDFFQLFTYNQDWLDKPHFPFWAILLSFKIFGVSVWAYRLPALLFFIISLAYTWLFARKYYSWQIAAIAVLILSTAQHILLSNTDVRAEPYLMALIIGSIYHIARLEERFTPTDLFLAALLTACAIMTKGIFVITAIYGSLLGQLLFQKKFKNLFQLKWLALFVLTFIFTLPEFYALYIQFDLHPEKTVFAQHNVSGIKWFLWDSQFGRFVNNGPITRKTSGTIFFYLHTLLWAFAPWCLLLYYALFKNVKSLFQKIKLAEYYTLFGGGLLFLLFSLSRFQLPFYTNAVFPLFAIITAPLIYQQINKFEAKFTQIAQWIFIVLLPLVIILVQILSKPADNLFFIIDCFLCGIAILFIVLKIKDAYQKTFFLSCTTALFAGFYLNTVFYNEIIPYKGQIAAAEFINQKLFEKYHVYAVNTGNNIFQFYCKKPVDLVPLKEFNNFIPKETSVFYLDQESMDYLIQTHADYKLVQSFVNYQKENILPKFINKTTRHEVLERVFVVTIEPTVQSPVAKK